MNVFKVEFKKISKGLITWTISICAILAMYIAFFPSMQSSGMDELVNAKMEMMPKALQEAFGFDNMPNFMIYTDYISYILAFIMLGVCAYGLILGFKALSSEEQDKTIEFQMANPISRAKLITSKMFSGFLAITIVGIALLITALIGGQMFSETECLASMATIMAMSIIPVYVYLFVGFMLSAVLKKSFATTGTSLAIFFGAYIMGTIGGVVEKISFLKYVSPSNYVVSSDVLNSKLVNSTKQDFDMKGIYIGIIIIVISIIATYVVYNKKDMDI